MSKIHPNQKNTAKKVFNEFLNNPTEPICVISQPQAGKTGLSIALGQLFLEHHIPISENTEQSVQDRMNAHENLKMILISPSDNNLEQQTLERFENHEWNISTTTRPAVINKKAFQTFKYSDSKTKKEDLEDICSGDKAKIIFSDEAHIGHCNDGIIHDALYKSNRISCKFLPVWVSASPAGFPGEADGGHVCYLPPGKGYFGVKDAVSGRMFDSSKHGCLKKGKSESTVSYLKRISDFTKDVIFPALLIAKDPTSAGYSPENNIGIIRVDPGPVARKDFYDAIKKTVLPSPFNKTVEEMIIDNQIELKEFTSDKTKSVGVPIHNIEFLTKEDKNGNHGYLSEKKINDSGLNESFKIMFIVGGYLQGYTIEAKNRLAFWFEQSQTKKNKKKNNPPGVSWKNTTKPLQSIGRNFGYPIQKSDGTLLSLHNLKYPIYADVEMMRAMADYYDQVEKLYNSGNLNTQTLPRGYFSNSGTKNIISLNVIENELLSFKNLKEAKVHWGKNNYYSRTTKKVCGVQKSDPGDVNHREVISEWISGGVGGTLKAFKANLNSEIYAGVIDFEKWYRDIYQQNDPKHQEVLAKYNDFLKNSFAAGKFLVYVEAKRFVEESTNSCYGSLF